MEEREAANVKAMTKRWMDETRDGREANEMKGRIGILAVSRLFQTLL